MVPLRLKTHQRRATASLVHGFSLPELLAVVVIIGITAAIGIQGFFFLVRRARVQSVALEVAGWIENVRNSAADEVDPVANQGGCVITFNQGAMAAGELLASVDQDCTLPEDQLRIPQTVQQDTVNVSITEGSSPVIFTPRGLWTDGQGAVGVPFQLNFNLASGGALRCIRLSPTLGSVEIGRPPNSAGGACQNWQTL